MIAMAGEWWRSPDRNDVLTDRHGMIDSEARHRMGGRLAGGTQMIVSGWPQAAVTTRRAAM